MQKDDNDEVISLADEEGHGLGWGFPGGGDEGDLGDRSHAASTATPIDESNKGFQLLAKLGWSRGKGLGRNEDGG